MVCLGATHKQYIHHHGSSVTKKHWINSNQKGFFLSTSHTFIINFVIIYYLVTLIHIFVQFLWTPYCCNELSRLITMQIFLMTQVVVLLICFATVELHPVDQVMRQFGFRQNISNDPLNLDQLHKEDMRARTNQWWLQYHITWIQM